MHSDNRISKIYKLLFKRFGPQHWWPAETRFEVIVGAMLTQNAAWSNVKKAIFNLKKAKVLTFDRLLKIDDARLKQLIRPAGYFNIKTKRLKNLLNFIKSNYKGDLRIIRRISIEKIRQELLSVNGVGKETADSIILYAFDKPIFVVDAYTRRVLSRHRLFPSDSSYDEIQAFICSNLKKNVQVYKEFHALIVRLGKEYCKKRKPLCQSCPLREI